MSTIEPNSPGSVRVPIEQGSAALNRLIARRVYARPAPEQPQAAGDAIPMYRNPALKNEAATLIQIGRKLDVKG